MARPDVKITIAGDASSLDKATKQASMSLDEFNKKAEKTAREAKASFEKMQMESGKGKAFGELEGQISNIADNILPGGGKAFEHFAQKAGGAEQAVKQLGPPLVALAVVGKGVSDFENLGQAVLKFQRIAGTTAEESSRWVEVLDDYNVSADQGAAIIGKFAKVIGTTPGVLKQYGVEIQKNKDGTVDLNGTLMAAADVFANTTDETKKAALGTALFGKSWQDMVPILEQGSAGIKNALGSVSQGKVLNQGDLKTAEDFRLAIDSLKDTLESLSVTIGKNATPALKEFAQVAGQVGSIADNSLTRPLLKGVKAFMDVLNPIHLASRAMEEWKKATTDVKDSKAIADFVTSDLAPGMKLAAAATKAADTATKDWSTSLHANMRAKQDVADVTQVLAEKEAKAKKATDDAEKAAQSYAKQLDEARKKSEGLLKATDDLIHAHDIDLPKALDDVTESLLGYYKTVDESKEAQKGLAEGSAEYQLEAIKQRDAGRELETQMLNYGNQVVAAAEAQAELNGHQLTAEEKATILAGAMRDLGNKFPPLQTEADKLAGKFDAMAGAAEDSAIRITAAMQAMADNLAGIFNRLDIGNGLSMITATADRLDAAAARIGAVTPDSLAAATRLHGGDAMQRAIGINTRVG